MIPVEDLSPIAQPLAQKKLLKKLHKTVKKGAYHDRGPFFLYILTFPSVEVAASEARGQGGREGDPEGGEGVRTDLYFMNTPSYHTITASSSSPPTSIP